MVVWGGGGDGKGKGEREWSEIKPWKEPIRKFSTDGDNFANEKVES